MESLGKHSETFREARGISAMLWGSIPTKGGWKDSVPRPDYYLLAQLYPDSSTTVFIFLEAGYHLLLIAMFKKTKGAFRSLHLFPFTEHFITTVPSLSHHYYC